MSGLLLLRGPWYRSRCNFTTTPGTWNASTPSWDLWFAIVGLILHRRQHVCRLPCGAGFVAGIEDHPDGAPRPQTDGTLAHALERWIGVVASPVTELSGDCKAMPGFGYRWSEHSQTSQHSLVAMNRTEPIPDLPLIDSPLFSAHRAEDVFGDHQAVAEQLHQQGFAVVDLGRERMQGLADDIRQDLSEQFASEVEAWKARGCLYGPRMQDAWQQSSAVRKLALLPEFALC